MMNALSAPAQAGKGPMAPTEALSILAQARTLDARCGFLKGSAHDELASYAARAEIVTAERMGVKAAESAVSRGTKAGRKAACDSSGRALVQDALAAAREAVRQARRITSSPRRTAASRTVSSTGPGRRVLLLPGPGVMNERTVALIDNRRSANVRPVARISGGHTGPRTIVIISGRNEHSAHPKARTGNPEIHYVAMTAEYYRQLRCGSTDRKALMHLYEKVRRAHYALLRTKGPKVTARAKAQAKALAARRSCRMHVVRR